jgi:hypothetical protein
VGTSNIITNTQVSKYAYYEMASSQGNSHAKIRMVMDISETVSVSVSRG